MGCHRVDGAAVRAALCRSGGMDLCRVRQMVFGRRRAARPPCLVVARAGLRPRTRLDLAYGIAQISEPGARKQLALERHGALQAVSTAANIGDAVQRLGSLGVQWYVVSGSRGPRWDAERSRADFVAGEIAVYAVRRR